MRMAKRLASVAGRVNCHWGRPKRRVISCPAQTASSVGSMKVTPRRVCSVTAWTVGAGACPAIAPVSPRQKSTYVCPSISTTRAPSAATTNGGIRLAQRTIQFIGTPASNDSRARPLRATDFGCSRLKRSSSRASRLATRAWSGGATVLIASPPVPNSLARALMKRPEIERAARRRLSLKCRKTLLDDGRGRAGAIDEPDQRDDAPSDQGIDRHRDQRLRLEDRPAFLGGVEDTVERRPQRPGHVVHEADKRRRIRAEQLQQEPDRDQDIDETDDPPDDLDGAIGRAAFGVDRGPRGRRGRDGRYGRYGRYGRNRRHGRGWRGRPCWRAARGRLLSDDFAV